MDKTASDPQLTNVNAATPPASVPAPPLQPETQVGGRSTPSKKYLRWYFLLIALAVVALAGVIVTRVKMRSPQPAIEKRITTNSSEAPIVWAVISPDGK